jgi:hypothetical protein
MRVVSDRDVGDGVTFKRAAAREDEDGGNERKSKTVVPGKWRRREDHRREHNADCLLFRKLRTSCGAYPRAAD